MSHPAKKRKKTEIVEEEITSVTTVESPNNNDDTTGNAITNSTSNLISLSPSSANKTNLQLSKTIDDVLVFQCYKCLSIVGDSTAFLLANKELRIVTLKAVSCISVSYALKDLETSNEGNTLGSTYYACKCAHCKTILGRVYKTTPGHLDHLRDYFTLDSDCILTYKIGSHQQIASNINFPKPFLPSIQDYQRQEANVVKAQQMVLLFRDQLANLEKQVASLTEKIQSNHSSTPETVVSPQAENGTKDV